MKHTHHEIPKSKKKYFRALWTQTIVWAVAITFWTFMREFGQEVVREYPSLPLYKEIKVHIVLSIIAGFLFGNLEYFYENKVLKHMPFGKAVLIGSGSYLVTTILLITLGFRIFTRAMDIPIGMNDYREFMLSKQTALLIFYCFVVGFFIDFFKQVDKKFGPGNLMRMLKGEFYEPKEDHRIFMFLDLRSSTSIAEQLGHLRYSRLIQDCFADLEVVVRYHAEIYQYVGDEVVLTWESEKGLENDNSIHAFFAFRDQIQSRAAYYIKEYGVVPEFKAGINIGVITVAEVGEIKREIAYHGDTINTAARIQSKCNEYGELLLISERLEKKLPMKNGFQSHYVGEAVLKGKSKAVDIYSVKLKNPSLS